MKEREGGRKYVDEGIGEWDLKDVGLDIGVVGFCQCVYR